MVNVSLVPWIEPQPVPPWQLVQGRPEAILANRAPSEVPPPAGLAEGADVESMPEPARGWLDRLLGRGG